jgi:methylmalonyl-CoA mutase, N-terminal domain
MADDGAFSPSGIPLDQWYGDDGSGPPPGDFPYTRGFRPEGYRQRPWTMRQYAGFGSAEESNRRFKMLLAGGQTGLSVAFDLPTQIGYAADDPLAEGEVGRVGVHIDTLADMEMLLADIPLGEVTTSMTINATAALLLLLYQLVGERQGVDPAKLGGTIQNDILKEYIARGTYIFPPRHSMRLITDTFAYCGEHLPQWNTISISGYHIREAGATAVQELAFTMANAIAYVDAARSAGLHIDQFGPRLSFFFNGHSDFFEEIAKFRAARAIWARIAHDRFGATNPRAMMLRFHTQTAGCSATAQQPENNIVRVAFEALSAVLGGTQSLHTNSMDEVLALPTEKSVEIALRTQQVLAYETNVTNVADPLGGSYYVEALTDEMERQALGYFRQIEEFGGVIEAIEAGFFQREIADASYRYQRSLETKDRIVVGVNAFERDETQDEFNLLKIGREVEAGQARDVRAVRAARDAAAVEAALAALKRTCASDENVMPALIAASRALATEGEIVDAMAEVFGRYIERASY